MSKLEIERYPQAGQSAGTLPTGAKRLLETIQQHAHSLFLERGDRVAVGTPVAQRRRVGPGNFTPSRSQNRA